MRIGVIGWYGRGNAGDERILWVLRRFFDGHEVIPTIGFEDARDRMEELNRCDLVLLGGGGLIQRRFGRYADVIADIRSPFASVGISVEAVHPDNQALIDAIKAKAEFILVRDPESAEAFGNGARVAVGPDLTFLSPYDVVEPTTADRCAVNLRPWHYWNAEYQGRLHRLIGRLDRRIPGFKALYPFPRWQPEQAIHILRACFQSLVALPMCWEPDVISDTEILRQFFASVDQQDPALLLERSRYTVAMRLHTLIFACQMGIPFVSLSYQPKNVAFCKAVGLEEYSVSLHDLSSLADTARTMKQNEQAIRAQLLDYRESQYRKARDIMAQLFGKRLQHATVSSV